MTRGPSVPCTVTGAAAVALVLVASPMTHAQPADVSGQAEELLDRVFVPATPETASFIVQLIGQQLATFPVGSSSGSFSEVVNESDPLALPQRAGVTHGPLFAERTLPLGRPWKASAGVSVQYSGFSRVADWDLDAMPLRTVTEPGYEGKALLDLRISSTTIAAFANLALRRNLDVGITVPTVRLHVTAAVSERENGATRVVARGASDAYGLGDIALRMKYRPGGGTTPGERGLALAGEVRLPTGNSRELLGAGRGRLTGTLVYTSEVGQVAPHVNVVYTRWLGEGTRVLAPRQDSSYLHLGTAGVKVALGSNWLAVGHLTFPLRTNGMRPAAGFAVGLEREFGFTSPPWR